MIETIIKTQNLTRKYGKQVSVGQLNMEVKKGEIYGFLGPNGAGKTTTIRMLLGLIKPTSGGITIFGKDFAQNRLEILQRIGSLVESPSHYGHLTGQENLEAVRRLIGAPAERISEVLSTVRLTKVANQLTREYSLGMKQRLGIATALLSKPDLLLLDEPTNGLDPSGIQEIRELIKTLPQKYGMSVVVSSHLLNEIDQMATQVGIITNGKLIFQDDIRKLRQKSKPRLRIATADVPTAFDMLKQKGIEPEMKDNHLWIDETNPGIVSDLNHYLVKEGIPIYRLEEIKPSLEDIFLELTGKEGSL
ncbi:ABC transporter ATP-binding protein [Virgibacillus sp. NKC19-3]|uniref:ABC transporter ATP-binding protein n=1 Tax=Virgibacillus saliphilus TaxID=2831674 RepID=UPI001C9A8220|nr:ABC transporter ATP-binding protein [Virgibacillus sp. NKC19-3]MBY7141932.1 ABC transporter ATP-binding protein [Virgibacillus sp. NKC19-3]